MFRQWIGPRELTTRMDEFDCRPGGSYRFVQEGNDGRQHAWRPARGTSLTAWKPA
ncbi:hypothetical protein ACQCSU_15800 [Pseudarthrobacter sp. O4]|uniref:hypothetical protein n=1 Tax=Pseudarthrobacter sp. O4 TaxID=3418417 RepID=UPI003CF8EBB4